MQHIKKHEKRYKELSDSASSFETWLKPAGRAGRWADGRVIQAAAERIGQPIVIWEEKVENQTTLWTRFVVAGKFAHGFACGGRDLNPVCLVLKDQHYQALVPPPGSAVPQRWLRETPNTVINLEGGGGSPPNTLGLVLWVLALPLCVLGLAL